MADVEPRTDRRRARKLYSPHDQHESVQDEIDRVEQQPQQGGLRVHPLTQSENDHGLNTGRAQAVQDSAQPPALQILVGSRDIGPQGSAGLWRGYRLAGIPGAGRLSPPRQQMISLHRTTSPLSRARHAMVGDG